MELKSACAASRPPRHPCSNRTFMELKYKEDRSQKAAKSGSNRTFMELKYRSAGGRGGGVKVLIAPLWN